jgi:hypothetical protein
MFLAFVLRGLSFPPHDFPRGLLFTYGIQLHDLNPSTILHIACFIRLCEFFLGIEPHWALWRRIFIIRRPLAYQTGGFNFSVRPKVDYFNLRTQTTHSGGQNGSMPRTNLLLAEPSGSKNFALLAIFDPGCLGGTL